MPFKTAVETLTGEDFLCGVCSGTAEDGEVTDRAIEREELARFGGNRNVFGWMKEHIWERCRHQQARWARTCSPITRTTLS